jgi:hypothetical protein
MQTTASTLSFRKCGLLALLAAAISLMTPASAATIRTGLLRPVIVALDGISPYATYLHFPSTKPYLAPKLAEQWNLKLCEFSKYIPNPGACDIIPVPWDGQLATTTQLANYRAQAKKIIENIVNNHPGRPLVIVAHSWGSVVAYQALIELQGSIPPDSVAVLATLASPLQATARPVDAGKLVISLLKARPGRIPGQEYVEGVVARKPDVVAHWVNYWIESDIISSPTPAADENERLFAKIGQCLPNPIPHCAYYEQSDLANLIYLGIGTNQDFVCNNLRWLGQPVQNAQFAAPYDVFSPKKDLNVHVDCADPPYGPSQYAITLEIGTGKVAGVTAETTTEIIWPEAHVRIGGVWHKVSLVPAANGREFHNWIEGHAEARITFDKPSPYVEDQQTHYVTAYTCRWIGGAWKCGCQNSTCSVSKWQLQAFKWR